MQADVLGGSLGGPRGVPNPALLKSAQPIFNRAALGNPQGAPWVPLEGPYRALTGLAGSDNVGKPPIPSPECCCTELLINAQLITVSPLQGTHEPRRVRLHRDPPIASLECCCTALLINKRLITFSYRTTVVCYHPSKT